MNKQNRLTMRLDKNRVTGSARGMKRTRVPWTAKLRPEMKHEIAPDPKGRGRMLFPTPLLVAETIAAIPKGSLLTVSELRAQMAKRFEADVACALMTGIFYNLVAGAAEEQILVGAEPLAPYWRVVLDNRILSPKTPCGPDVQAAHLRREGHRIETVRGKLRVTSSDALPGKDSNLD